ncbi:hypothetical protein [Alicyclobacillus acidocaldarius]|uniref:hypothetical protein n=1 Tax=Alicyclobacillus acidocaldarius TaxID=405212 RepID=UPI00345ED835
MKRPWSAALAALIALGTGASPTWAAAHPSPQPHAGAAGRVRADDLASTSMTAEIQVIHDALTVPELAAVQAAAQAASNVSPSQWLQWLYPNASPATSAQSQAAQAVANLFNLATYGAVSTRGSNAAQILQTLQSISPLLSPPAVGLFYQSFDRDRPIVQSHLGRPSLKLDRRQRARASRVAVAHHLRLPAPERAVSVRSRPHLVEL